MSKFDYKGFLKNNPLLNEIQNNESDYLSEDERRADISNRLRQSIKDDRDEEDENEDGIEIGTEPEEAPKPKGLSAAEKRKRGHKNRQANRDRAEQQRLEKEKRNAAEKEKGSDILLSNRHTINAYSGKIKAIDGSGKIYDSLDDAPPYFKNTLSDRDKYIVYQVTNVALEEELSSDELEKIKLLQQFSKGERDDLPDISSDAYKAQKVRDLMRTEELQGKDVNALALVTLDSVGHYLDIDTAEVYPINADDTPDFKNAFSLHDEIDEEFINALSERDRLVVARYTDQVM